HGRLSSQPFSFQLRHLRAGRAASGPTARILGPLRALRYDPPGSIGAPARVLGRERPLARPLSQFGLFDRNVEAGDNARIAFGLAVGIPSRDPRVAVFGIGDDVGEAPGAHREQPNWFVSRIAERVQPGPAFRAEDEVPRGELLSAVQIPEHRAAAEN